MNFKTIDSWGNGFKETLKKELSRLSFKPKKIKIYTWRYLVVMSRLKKLSISDFTNRERRKILAFNDLEYFMISSQGKSLDILVIEGSYSNKFLSLFIEIFEDSNLPLDNYSLHIELST